MHIKRMYSKYIYLVESYRIRTLQIRSSENQYSLSGLNGVLITGWAREARREADQKGTSRR